MQRRLARSSISWYRYRKTDWCEIEDTRLHVATHAVDVLNADPSPSAGMPLAAWAQVSCRIIAGEASAAFALRTCTPAQPASAYVASSYFLTVIGCPSLPA